MLFIYIQGTTMGLRFPITYETNRSIISRGNGLQTEYYNVFNYLIFSFIYLIYFNSSYYPPMNKQVSVSCLNQSIKSFLEPATVHTNNRINGFKYE